MYNEEYIKNLNSEALCKVLEPLIERLAKKYESSNLREINSIKREDKKVYILTTLDNESKVLWEFRIRNGEYPTILDGLLFRSEEYIFQ